MKCIHLSQYDLAKRWRMFTTNLGKVALDAARSAVPENRPAGGLQALRHRGV